MSTTIHPGDIITALGLSFPVWRILYQDCCLGHYDVEFIDTCGGYHHWKQVYDGGSVTRSGIPGTYFLDMYNPDQIACIREARTAGTYTARIIERSGTEHYLGRYGSVQAAEDRLHSYGEAHGAAWRQM